jgi:hypothetical protein
MPPPAEVWEIELDDRGVLKAMSENGVIDSAHGVMMMIPDPMPEDSSVTLTSSTAVHGGSRPVAIAVAVMAVVALAVGALAMSSSSGARTTPKPQVTPTTEASAGPVTPDDMFIAAVRPLVPGESQATLIATGRAFCQTVAANQGDIHAAALEAMVANHANTSSTIVDTDLMQIDGAAVSAYCPQYNIDALTFN